MNVDARKHLTGDGSLKKPSLPGFEHIRRFWDRQYNTTAARILPGEYYVSASDELIVTVLGSCVSACIRDRNIGIGGMNHFMLPEGEVCSLDDKDCINSATRYGSYAMEHMINDILAHGGSRGNLEIKLFGGGNVLSSMTNIGQRNIQFVHRYLRMEGLRVSAEDLGGTSPRKVLYFPNNGRVLVRQMPITKVSKIARRELDYQKTLEHTPVAGEIDLF